MRQKNDAPTKCAIVVSGKISRKAVVRNKIRRRAYEAIAESHIKKGHLAIFYARGEAREATARQIAADIKNILEQRGMRLHA